jgi:hypothetical protein
MMTQGMGMGMGGMGGMGDMGHMDEMRPMRPPTNEELRSCSKGMIIRFFLWFAVFFILMTFFPVVWALSVPVLILLLFAC